MISLPAFWLVESKNCSTDAILDMQMSKSCNLIGRQSKLRNFPVIWLATGPISAIYYSWHPVLQFIYSEKDKRRERSEDVIKLINDLIHPFIQWQLWIIYFCCSIGFAPSMWATSSKTNNYVKKFTVRFDQTSIAVNDIYCFAFSVRLLSYLKYHHSVCNDVIFQRWSCVNLVIFVSIAYW